MQAALIISVTGSNLRIAHTVQHIKVLFLQCNNRSHVHTHALPQLYACHILVDPPQHSAELPPRSAHSTVVLVLVLVLVLILVLALASVQIEAEVQVQV